MATTCRSHFRIMKSLFLSRHIIVCLCALIESATSAFAQAQSAPPDFYSNIDKPDYHPPSPEAAALGKYGQYNVNLNTGIPDITIPIYSLKVGAFTFPISISYNASGIKVTEIASRVGLGWTLNAGGMIAQNAMGILDGYEPMLVPPATYDPTCGNANCVPNADYYLAKDILDGRIYDTEPDVYIYNFLGFSGKYVNTPTGTATLPFTSDITFDGGAIDKNGNTYLFEASESSFVFRNCNSYAKNPLSQGITANYLTKIITAQGDSIRLVYDQELYSYFQSVSAKKYFQATGADMTCELPPDELCRDRNSVSVPRLSQIIASNGITINFIYTDLRKDVETNVTSPNINSARALNGIQVTEGGTTYNYSLAYDTISAGAGTDGKAATGMRMYLKKFTDKDGGVYQFQYTTQSSLPPRDSYSIDHYGYFNSRNNATLIPSYSDVNFIGANRSINEFSVQSGSLEKITYPTGGYSVFTLEPHYADISGFVGSGLRVKSITNYGIDNTVLSQKNYKYTSGTDTGISDIGMIVSNYADQLTQRKANNQGSFFELSEGSCQFIILSSSTSSFFDFVGLNPNAQYAVVEVTDADATQSGKSIFYYAGLDFGDATPAPMTDGRMEMKLKKEEHYRFTGPGTGNFQILSKKEYQYQTLPDVAAGFTYDPNNTINYSQALGFRIKYLVPEQAAGPEIPNFYPAVYLFRHYKYTSIWYFMNSMTETIYDGSNTFTQSSQYEYEKPAHAQLTKTTTYDSKGNVLTHVTRYPQDYLNGGITGVSVPGQWAFKGVPVEELSFLNGKLISAQLNEMKYENSSLNLSKKHVFNLNTPLDDQTNYPPSNSSTFTSLLPTGNPYREYFRIVSTDTKGNPTEILYDGGYSQALIWNTSKRQVLARGDNTTLANMAYTDFDSSNKGSWAYANNFNSSGFAGSQAFNGTSVSKSGLTTALTYRIGVWAKNAVPSISGYSATTYVGNDGWTHYEWLVTNLTSVTVTTNGALLDNLRLCPSNSMMSTYSYQPLVGLVSKTDANNKSEYYSYDASGRLKTIKDDSNNILKTYEYHFFQDVSH